MRRGCGKLQGTKNVIWLMRTIGDETIRDVSAHQDFRLFPCEAISAEVTIRTGFLVDGLSQIEFSGNKKLTNITNKF